MSEDFYSNSASSALTAPITASGSHRTSPIEELEVQHIFRGYNAVLNRCW